MKYIKLILSEWFLIVCLHISVYCLLDCDSERGNGIMGVFVLYLIFGVRSKIYFIGVGLLTILFGLSVCTPLPQKCSTSINEDLILLSQSDFPIGFLLVLIGFNIIIFYTIHSFESTYKYSKMKLIFSYLNLERNTGNFHHDSFRQAMFESKSDENYNVRYNTILCGYIREFDSLDVMAWVFDGISKVERNISSTEERSSNHFQAIYKKDSVTINFLLANDNDPNWPTETFPITEVKAALEGWKKFLEMPESFDSVVEVYI